MLLKHSVDRNLVREMFRAKQNAIEAWRQVVEVLFAVCPVDILPLEVKYTAIIDILGELNQKVGVIIANRTEKLQFPKYG